MLIEEDMKSATVNILQSLSNHLFTVVDLPQRVNIMMFKVPIRVNNGPLKHNKFSWRGMFWWLGSFNLQAPQCNMSSPRDNDHAHQEQHYQQMVPGEVSRRPGANSSIVSQESWQLEKGPQARIILLLRENDASASKAWTWPKTGNNRQKKTGNHSQRHGTGWTLSWWCGCPGE